MEVGKLETTLHDEIPIQQFVGVAMEEDLETRRLVTSPQNETHQNMSVALRDRPSQTVTPLPWVQPDAGNSDQSRTLEDMNRGMIQTAQETIVREKIRDHKNFGLALMTLSGGTLIAIISSKSSKNMISSKVMLFVAMLLAMVTSQLESQILVRVCNIICIILLALGIGIICNVYLST